MVETQTIWSDFLLKQLPVIVVLGYLCYAMYKYFTKELSKKDEEIKELNNKLVNLTSRVLQATEKQNEIMASLRQIVLKWIENK